MSRTKRNVRFGGIPVGYTPVATSVAFDTATLLLNGAVGTALTDVARVYDQQGALMVPQPSGTMSYASDTTGVATVNSSTGVVTSVANGTATVTATFTPS